MIPFWNWFLSHAESLTMLNDLEPGQRSALLDEMQHQLTAYCDGLTCEVGPATPNGRTLTISAEGDIDRFSSVVELVEQAPDIDWWEFVAFRQPQGDALTVRFDRYRFDTRRMFFQQLESDEMPDQLGLRVSLPPDLPADADPDDVEVGVYVTLEALLGEVDCATLLAYFDTVPAIVDAASARREQFRPLSQLPALVARMKQNEKL